MLVWNNSSSWVLDVQVCADANVRPISSFHELKVSKYNNEAIKEFALIKTGFSPDISSLTFDWRGTAAPATLKVLKVLGVPVSDLNLFGVRVVEGGTSIYANYMGTSGGGDVG